MFVPRSIEDVLAEVKATGRFSIRRASAHKEHKLEGGGGKDSILANIAALQQSIDNITRTNAKVSFTFCNFTILKCAVFRWNTGSIRY